MVCENNGSREDAEDLFQEALIIFYGKLNTSDFQLSCSYKTYLYSVCRNMWLDKLKYKNRIIHINEIILERFYLGPEIGVEDDFNDQYDLFLKCFDKLETQCKLILELYINDISMKNIAQSLDLKSQIQAKKKKFLCKKCLIKLLKQELILKKSRNIFLN